MNDKEGRKWLLQKLYDNGIKYIAYSPFYGGYVGVKEMPIISGKGEVVNDTKTVITLHGLFAKCDGCNIYYYKKGKTSWTFDDIALAHKSMISLAGGDDEN